VVQAVDEDWRLGEGGKFWIRSRTSVEGKRFMRSKRRTGEASRQGCSSQQARSRRGCNAEDREWLRLEHYYGLYMHNITPSYLQLTAMIDGGKDRAVVR
jgi:hypothetical protein